MEHQSDLQASEGLVFTRNASDLDDRKVDSAPDAGSSPAGTPNVIPGQTHLPTWDSVHVRVVAASLPVRVPDALYQSRGHENSAGYEMLPCGTTQRVGCPVTCAMKS